jgi:hypothetical protein
MIYQVLPFSLPHAYSFPILNTTHINWLSLLLYDEVLCKAAEDEDVDKVQSFLIEKPTFGEVAEKLIAQ